MKTFAAALFAFSIAAPAMAAEGDKPWKDTAELSYVKTTGNSKNSTLSAKNLFNYDWTRAALELAAGALGTNSEGSTTAEQYNASEKVSLKLSGKNYAFERLGWDKNRFANINDRWDFGVGLGRNLIDNDTDKLSLELGGGYIWEDRITSKNEDFGTYRGYAKYIRTLSPTANASQDLEWLGNLKDSSGYRVNAETALVASINSHMSMKASYVWKLVNKPGAGFRRSDTITAVSLIINY
jgi:putative salt-induced outer membrane protein